MAPIASLNSLVELDGHERDSEAGYAVRTLVIIRSLKSAIACGDAELAAAFGFDLGVLLQESVMKRRHEAAALEGAKLRDGRQAHNTKRKQDRQPEDSRWQAKAEQIRAIDPELGESAVARRIKRALGLTESIKTITRRISRK